MISSTRLADWFWEDFQFPLLRRRQAARLTRRTTGWRPRVAIVKQDCNEDLYCCEPGCSVRETLQSTLLRSGPAALFTLFDTTFYIVRTELDPECNLWREKWDPLRWCPVEWFEAFRDHVPGRDHGQSHFARSVEDIDWSQFDIVVSVDVSVPSRVTSLHPGVLWAYYVREVKAPSWKSSLAVPVAGQDIYLSQRFAPRPPRSAKHVVEFPYHFQYYGMYHEILGLPLPPNDEERHGVFLEYHTSRAATPEHLAALAEFGPVYACTSEDDRMDPRSGEPIPLRSMEPEALAALMRSKYHVNV